MRNAIVDTVCFALFDRTPHAWRKVEQWARRRDEFSKRAAFAHWSFRHPAHRGKEERRAPPLTTRRRSVCA